MRRTGKNIISALAVETQLGYLVKKQRCQKEVFLEKCYFLGPHLGTFFVDVLFSHEVVVCVFMVFWKLCFCVILCVFFTVGNIKNH